MTILLYIYQEKLPFYNDFCFVCTALLILGTIGRALKYNLIVTYHNNYDHN